MTDPLFHILAALPSAEPDPVRADRVRKRCRAALARRRSYRPTQPAGVTRFWAPLIACLSGVYLTEVIRQALQLSGIL